MLRPLPGIFSFPNFDHPHPLTSFLPDLVSSFLASRVHTAVAGSLVGGGMQQLVHPARRHKAALLQWSDRGTGSKTRLNVYHNSEPTCILVI